MEDWLYLEPLRACMEDYLRQCGLSVKKPFCCLNPAHDDKRPSMSYNPRVKNVHCFSCGANYDLFDLIALDYNIASFAEQYKKACEIFGFTINTPAIKKANIIINRELDILEKHDRTVELLELEASANSLLTYFLNRGITAESCKKYKFFEKDGRAYLPVFENGNCIGWTARAVREDITPRYKNSKGSTGIWNGDIILKNGVGNCLFVTEGIFDAVILEQLGVRAVALCGSQNVKKLMRICSENIATASTWKYICCGDPDDAGARMNSELKDGLKKLGFSFGELILPENSCDINELCIKNQDKLENLINDCKQNITPDAEAAAYAATSALTGLDSFFDKRERFADNPAVSTGFDGLDKLLDGGLHTGLYILGAISSLGKTSLMLQIADYIAGNGQDVLFFSLEQSRFELIAKSLSRTSAALDGGLKSNAFTARQLLSGATAEDIERDRLLKESRRIYAKSAAGMFIREGIADIGVAEIRAAVREHVTMRKIKPVVIIDYLQILSPENVRASDKQSTDRAMVELKRISRDFDIPVIAVSSFNRENYRAAVSMEAFKESGAVEYSSDVLFGLQLKGAGSQGFDVNMAKSRQPRQIELVILKNRNGIPYAKLDFDYDARFSLFEESAARAVSNNAARYGIQDKLRKYTA